MGNDVVSQPSILGGAGWCFLSFGFPELQDFGVIWETSNSYKYTQVHGCEGFSLRLLACSETHSVSLEAQVGFNSCHGSHSRGPKPFVILTGSTAFPPEAAPHAFPRNVRSSLAMHAFPLQIFSINKSEHVQKLFLT